MNNTIEDRVMAYNLAQEIKHDDLDQVAGGDGVGRSWERTNTSIMINGQCTAQIDVRCDM